MVPGNRDALLLIIEAQADISGRFTNPSRIGTAGGDGHFSLVVSALDNNTGRRVALKFYDPDHAADAYRSSCFQREAEMLQQFVGMADILQQVVPLQTFSLVSMVGAISIPIHFSYYGAELAAGSVAEASPHSQWSLPLKLDRFRAMCRAVQRVHAADVVHRDLKLSNFLTMRDGSVRLCDFGTARFTNSPDQLLPRYNLPVGDMRYAAPELFAALQEVDSTMNVKGDIYALGAAFFELLTGMILNPLVFDGSTLADLSNTMNAVPKKDRVRIYDSFVSGMAASRPLPRLSYCGVDLPSCVSGILEGLYQDLCAIDYRRRLSDFKTIFSRLSRASIILRNEASYLKWQKRKQLYRERAESKKLRREARRARKQAV